MSKKSRLDSEVSEFIDQVILFWEAIHGPQSYDVFLRASRDIIWKVTLDSDGRLIIKTCDYGELSGYSYRALISEATNFMCDVTCDRTIMYPDISEHLDRFIDVVAIAMDMRMMSFHNRDVFIL